MLHVGVESKPSEPSSHVSVRWWMFTELTVEIISFWTSESSCRTPSTYTVRVRAQSRPTLHDPWAVAHQASPSMAFSGPESWSRVPFPSPGDLPKVSRVPWIGRWILYPRAIREALKFTQRCVTVCVSVQLEEEKNEESWRHCVQCKGLTHHMHCEVVTVISLTCLSPPLVPFHVWVLSMLHIFSPGKSQVRSPAFWL